MAFRYSLEYYATDLIKRMENVTSNTSNTSNNLETLILDIKDFIRIVCYYKETSNIKLYKQFNKLCVEKILLSNQHGKNFTEAINDLKPPIFFKDKAIFLSQCKLWSFKKIVI